MAVTETIFFTLTSAKVNLLALLFQTCLRTHEDRERRRAILLISTIAAYKFAIAAYKFAR